MNTYRMGNAYNVKTDKTFHCIEVMIKGKWMPVILDHGLAIYEDYTSCYSIYTKLITEERNKGKNKNTLIETKTQPLNNDTTLKNENERLKKTIMELNKKLKQQQKQATAVEKDVSELGGVQSDDN